MAKTGKNLPKAASIAKKAEKKVAKVDSMMVGGTKRALADVSKAVSKLNSSPSSKSYVKGVSVSNPYSSSKTLGSKGSASDLVNKVIDGGKKKK